jgi:alcohol dehydrogenase class IV
MPESTTFGVLRLPDQVLFGIGVLDALGREAKTLGQRVFICSDAFIAGTPLFLAAAKQLREADLTVEIFTDIVPELPVDTVVTAAEIARAFAPDVVVGFGGGSAIDIAKLVSLLLAHPGPLSDYYGENRVPGPVLPLIAVPTTAGTGSEVTPVAVVSDPDRELKVGISSPRLIPRVAIVDPRLTLGAPPSVMAYSGIDAFVHGVESFTAANNPPDWSAEIPVFVGRNSLSSLVGLEAIRLIGTNLRTAVLDPSDVPSHESMAYGSLLAGMAFGSAGTHLSHAIQYPVGALTKTPHGLGTGLLLPYVLEAAFGETVVELASIAEALGVESSAGSSDVERARAAIGEIRSLVADIGIPRTLADIGIERDQLDHIATLALTVTRLAGNSTISADRNTIDPILEAALTGSFATLAH